MADKKDIVKYPNIHVKHQKGESQFALVAKIGRAMREAGVSKEQIGEFYDHVIREEKNDTVYETIGLYVNLQS